jgi:hypothetical protein
MKRASVIGGLLLAAIVGLIVAERLGEPQPGARDSGDTGGAATVLAQAGAPQAESAPSAGAGEARVYTVDAAQSEVYWRIYRAGAAARLGHNHVISVSGLEGTVRLTDDVAAAEWSLSFPVAALIVDDPELRARYGKDFESVPSERDKAGTRENMLTDRVLNGAMFPEISLHGIGVEGPLEDAHLPLTIEMLGRSIEQSFPATISIEDGSLTVTGEYRLTHEDLGLEPFTALGGLMAVGDDIDFTYKIHAIAGAR